MASPTGNPASALPAASAALISAHGTASTHFRQWLVAVKRVLSPGISATVVLAPTTSGGVAGSLTVVNGIVTAYTAPT